MMNSRLPVVILSTTSGPEEASLLARRLVETQTAACVQVIEGARSFYRWDNRIESAIECLLLIKTTEDNYAAVESMIRTTHEESGWYQTPEILCLTVAMGSPEYLSWLLESVAPGNEPRPANTDPG